MVNLMRNRARGAVAILLALFVVGVACGDDAGSSTTVPVTVVPPTTVPVTTVVPTTETPTTVPETTVPETTTTTLAPVEVTVTGVVISVDGDLSGTQSFVIRLESGDDLVLVPGDGLLFDEVAPLTHLRDHLVSGNPVEVTYEMPTDGPHTVTAVGDAAGGTDTHDD